MYVDERKRETTSHAEVHIGSRTLGCETFFCTCFSSRHGRLQPTCTTLVIPFWNALRPGGLMPLPVPLSWHWQATRGQAGTGNGDHLLVVLNGGRMVSGYYISMEW